MAESLAAVLSITEMAVSTARKVFCSERSSVSVIKKEKLSPGAEKLLKALAQYQGRYEICKRLLDDLGFETVDELHKAVNDLDFHAHEYGGSFWGRDLAPSIYMKLHPISKIKQAWLHYEAMLDIAGR